MLWPEVFVCLILHMLAVEAGEITWGHGTDCKSIHTDSPMAPSGVYRVCVGGACCRVYCDMETDGGGWTVFQRRATNITNFNQSWEVYADGFGNTADDYWLGNRKIHNMTATHFCDLRIDLEDWNNRTGYATYHDFSIDGEDNLFTLHIGDYLGDAELTCTGDSLSTYGNGAAFSANDMDNDGTGTRCALDWGGGWWHGLGCGHSALNGFYYEGAYSGATANGIRWYHWSGSHYHSFKKTEMKLRCSN